MVMQGPDAGEAENNEPLYVIDDGPLTEEDIEGLRAFLDNPEGVSTEVMMAMMEPGLSNEERDDLWKANAVRMSDEAVRAVRAELDALAARKAPEA
jgi:hypothetical protein